MIKLKSKKRLIVFCLVIILLLILNIVRFSFSTKLEQGAEVATNSELIYYLEVTYNGVDRYGVDSSSKDQAASVSLNSDYIYVEDVIPEGLEFAGFVKTNDGSIGAVGINSDEVCLGSVLDDGQEETLTSYHGLHYDEKTRKVTFTVQNLQAGCKLNVGIKTKTPDLDDEGTNKQEVRRDFYNYATAQENNYKVSSNNVHVFMGSEVAPLYHVTYEFIGDIPTGLDSHVNEMSYSEAAQVRVLEDAFYSGYKFSGWSTQDVEVKDGLFSMPAKDVTFVGSFTKQETHKITYEIEGEIPEGYIIPREKEVSAGDTFKLDSLQKGDTFNGYEFQGWTSDEAQIVNNQVVVGDSDITIKGTFKSKKYQVEYRFYETVLPPNSESLLPSTEQYEPGELVKLTPLEDVNNYKFLGWYKEETFVMPAQDVVIYGEWKEQNGVFAPTITNELQDTENNYRPGDIAHFDVTITNNEDYAIEDVIVTGDNDSSFTSSDSYEVKDDNLAVIPKLEAGESVVLESEYVVSDDDLGVINSDVSVIGARASNAYELDTSANLIATASLTTQTKLNICNTVNDDSRIFQYHISDTSDTDLWLTLSGSNCKTVYVDPGDFTVEELIPQDFELQDITIANTEGTKSNNKITFTAESGEYTVNFSNTKRQEGFLKSFGRASNLVKYELVSLYDTIKSNYQKNLYGVKATTNGTVGYKQVYYFTENTNNNVIFADKCWQIYRTTETEGVKLIYNGVPTNGKCDNTGDKSIISSSSFGLNNSSFAQIGYMYNKEYLADHRKMTTAGTYAYGRYVSYNSTTKNYTLSSTVNIGAWGSSMNWNNISNQHFTCMSSGTSCSTVYYIFGVNSTQYWSEHIYISDGVTSIDQVLRNMFSSTSTDTYVNTKNSNIKTVIDNWYSSNLINYTDYLEDAVWCNERSISDYGGWTSGGNVQNNFYFYSNKNPSRLTCYNNINSFTVDKARGNGDLTYPIGLITMPEATLSANAIKINYGFWTMTPSHHGVGADSSYVYAFSTSGTFDTSLLAAKKGVRPSISLMPNIKYRSGTGTKSDPYIIHAF